MFEYLQCKITIGQLERPFIILPKDFNLIFYEFINELYHLFNTLIPWQSEPLKINIYNNIINKTINNFWDKSIM